MPLDERRIALLREMGVPFWRPLGAAAGDPKPVRPSDPDLAGRSPDRLRTTAADHGGASQPTLETRAAPGAGNDPVRTPAMQAESAAQARQPAETGQGAMHRPEHSAGSSDRPVDSLPAQHVTTLDWPALRAAVADCRACGLCESRRQTVFGTGHTRAHWMVVGEAPGEQEDLRGEPFVGPAGQLLDHMLRALGLTRAEAAPEGQPPLTPAQQVYIANTLKCRPPRNRNPEPEEMRRCEPYLQRQIALVQPRLILAMGRFAVQALLRTDEAIGRLRGRVHRYEGVPLVVTYHPAYLLRNLPDKAKAWEDLCLAAHTVESLPPR